MHLLRFLPILIAGATAAAADPVSEMRLLGNCAGCAISDGDFSRFLLMGVDLSNADLRNVSFSDARMTVAVLNGARLDGVSFAGTDLRGATFVNARITNVDFTGANLAGAVFEGAVLVDSDLTTARLCKTQLPDDDMANDNCAEN